MKLSKLILLSTVCIGILSCEHMNKKDEPQEKTPPKPPTPVEAIRVEKTLVSREVRASGIAAGIRESYVVAETQGKIESVNFSLGQWVKKGHTLVRVNSAIQFAAYEQAKRASSVAELNLNVTQKLFNEGSASEAELTNAQSQTTGARAQFESTQKAYNDCRITAPISGYIAQKELTIEKGNVLAGGTLITRIVDILSLKTTISVGEMEIGILKKGMKAELTVPAIKDKNFAGKIVAIAAGSDPATGSYPVEIVWKNSSDRKIKSGMSVSATITTEESDSAILIPSLSLFDKEHKKAVFIASENKAAIRFVQANRAIGNTVEIIDGLAPGEVLITTGVTTLTRGEKVAVTIMGEPGGTQ